MELIATNLDGVMIVKPEVFHDSRGFFAETYRESWLNQNFIQDNHSRSQKDVLRGLHFQTVNPQGKLVQVIQGSIFDVVVDINRNSKNYGEWFGVELNGENKKQLYVPPSYAHGFLVLSDTADILYKCTQYYHPESEKCLLWNDPSIGIDWNLNGIKPIVSSKDENGLHLKHL